MGFLKEIIMLNNFIDYMKSNIYPMFVSDKAPQNNGVQLHLATRGDFSYLNYLSLMSAARFNKVCVWYYKDNEPNSFWWWRAKAQKQIAFRELEETGIILDVDDNTGRLDLIYLKEFTRDLIDQAAIVHTCIWEHKDVGEFDRKDIGLVKVFLPESEGNFSFITPVYIKESQSLFAELIRTVLLERVWNPTNE